MYTHYWTYSPREIKDVEEIRSKFLDAVILINKVYKEIKKNKRLHRAHLERHELSAYDKFPCIIRGGLGAGLPMLNESQVWFNGDKAAGMDHETFDIKWYPEGGTVEDFCKTARKPYDFMVCFSLLAFKHSFNDPKVFSISCDGENTNWAGAAVMYWFLNGNN